VDLQRLLAVKLAHTEKATPLASRLCRRLSSRALRRAELCLSLARSARIVRASRFPRQAAGDGEMLTTANPEFDQKFRRWRQHSTSVSDAVRHESSRVTVGGFSDLGLQPPPDGHSGQGGLRASEATAGRLTESAAAQHRTIIPLRSPSDGRQDQERVAATLAAAIAFG
jgi:hypothetical protein